MDKHEIAQLMKWKRGTDRQVGKTGAYTVRQSAMGDWYVTLTSTGETLRGPLDTAYAAVQAAERYERFVAGLSS